MGVSAIGNTKTVLAAAVANAGTFTVPYPAGTTQAGLTGTVGGVMAYRTGEKILQGTGGIGIAFGASNITITNNTGAAIPAGEYFLSFGEVDINGSYNVTTPKKVQALVTNPA